MGNLFLYHALAGLGLGVIGGVCVFIAQSHPEVRIFGRPVMTMTLFEIPVGLLAAALIAFVLIPMYDGFELTGWQKLLLLLTAAACCVAVMFLADLLLPEKRRPEEGIEEGQKD